VFENNLKFILGGVPQKHTPHLRPAKKCYGRDVIVQMAFKVEAFFTFE
jgi:hypothetical protein